MRDINLGHRQEIVYGLLRMSSTKHITLMGLWTIHQVWKNIWWIFY